MLTHSLLYTFAGSKVVTAPNGSLIYGLSDLPKRSCEFAAQNSHRARLRRSPGYGFKRVNVSRFGRKSDASENVLDLAGFKGL